MPSELLTAQQAQQRFGVSRSTLLRYEDEGLLGAAVSRTPGNQRRYRADALGRILGNQQEQERPIFTELGDTGLSRWGGSVDQAHLTELTGSAGWKLYREMRKNDPVIAAIFFAIEQSLKQASVRVKPASEKAADKKVAEFIDESRTDMSSSWSDTMDYACQMLEMGVS
ncbi:MAG: MerR family DNA-binding transcriptional regulator, partial [Gammaproteobacteria bacterium]|nr:MerR family DNA-binding transcriptional regulator [Gammaproteobacteria bacterium]